MDGAIRILEIMEDNPENYCRADGQCGRPFRGKMSIDHTFV